MPASWPLQPRLKNQPRQEVCTKGDFANFGWVGFDWVGLGRNKVKRSTTLL
jgi:hypothetical protein